MFWIFCCRRCVMWMSDDVRCFIFSLLMNPDISLNEKSYSMFSAYSVFKKICTDREGHSSSSANSWLVYSAYFHIFVGFFFQIKFMKTAKGGGFVSPPPLTANSLREIKRQLQRTTCFRCGPVFGAVCILLSLNILEEAPGHVR